MGNPRPGEFEQVVLLTLAACDDEASGRQVYDAIVSTTGREVSVAAVHITLNRLSEKGWARCRSRDPAPGQGGKRRRRYALSPEGAAIIADQRAKLERLWDRAADHPLLRGQEG